MAAVKGAGQHLYLRLPPVSQAEKWRASPLAVRDHVPHAKSICFSTDSEDIKPDREWNGVSDVADDGFCWRHALPGDDLRAEGTSIGRQVRLEPGIDVSEVLESMQ